MDGFFLYGNQELIDSLRYLEPPFRRLKEHLGQIHGLEEFMHSTLLQKNTKTLNQLPWSDNFEEVLSSNVQFLLKKGGETSSYVQCMGSRCSGGYKASSFNGAQAVLLNCEFERLMERVGGREVSDLLANYTILVRYKGQYVQVTGPNLRFRFQRKNIVSNEEKPVEDRRYPSNDIFYSNLTPPRNHILYCNYMGRRPGIHRRNIFLLKSKAWLYQPQQTRKALENIVNAIKNREPTPVYFEELQNLKPLLEQLLSNFRRLFGWRMTQEAIYAPPFMDDYFRCVKLPSNFQEIARKSKIIRELSQDQRKDVFNSLYDCDVSFGRVAALLNKVWHRVVPIQIFGRKNDQVIKQLLYDIVSMKRYENVRMIDVMAKMKVGQQWLLRGYERRKRVLANIINFMVIHVIIPVIQYNFYVSEKHREGGKLHYYPKQVWVCIARAAISLFETGNMVRTYDQRVRSVADATKKSKLLQGICENIDQDFPEGKLRILPKKDSFRPLLTFKRRVGNLINLNQFLRLIQLVLRRVKERLAQDFGFSLFDNYQLNRKWDSFVEKWRQEGCPDLSYFTLDIHKCYDSIDPIILLQMIHSTELFEDSYLLVKYDRLYRNKKALGQRKKEGIERSFVLRTRESAIPMTEDCLQIVEMEQPPSFHIFQARQNTITRANIIDVLTKVCTQITIQYGRYRWRQTHGIPQGLRVSGVLCNLYFAYLEKEAISIQNGLLLRLTDDYLYVGYRDEAVKVLKKMYTMAKLSNFQFSKEKSKGNFKSQYLGKTTDTKWVTWIGKDINLQTLEMFPQMSNSISQYYYAVNVNINDRNPLRYLRNKLKSLLVNQFHGFFKPHLFPYNSLEMSLLRMGSQAVIKFAPFIQQYLLNGGAAKEIEKVIVYDLEELVVYAMSFFKNEDITWDLYGKFVRSLGREAGNQLLRVFKQQFFVRWQKELIMMARRIRGRKWRMKK